jgi:hypothetical protein
MIRSTSIINYLALSHNYVSLFHNLSSSRLVLFNILRAKPFARSLEPNDTRLVTMGQERYRVYRYKGILNGLENAVVLLAWKADQLTTPEPLHCVLSTDRELSDCVTTPSVGQSNAFSVRRKIN